MNELEQNLARLKELGATPEEQRAYVMEYMRSRSQQKPDASRALQRERENRTGDWEAIPDWMKTTAGAAAMAIPGEAAAGMVGRGALKLLPRAAGAAAAGIEELPVAGKMVKSARAGLRAWQASKIMPKAEGFIGNGIENTAQAASVPEELAGMPEQLQQAIQRMPKASEPLPTPGQPYSPPWRGRGVTKARDEMWAEKIAGWKADPSTAPIPQPPAQVVGNVEDVPLQDLLELSLEHLKKGGSLRSASDALKIVRHP